MTMTGKLCLLIFCCKSGTMVKEKGKICTRKNFKAMGLFTVFIGFFLGIT